MFNTRPGSSMLPFLLALGSMATGQDMLGFSRSSIQKPDWIDSIDIVAEMELIEQKKSSLSESKQQVVISAYTRRQAKMKSAEDKRKRKCLLRLKAKSNG
ncbi:MAG: hypothetical protein WC976_06600 [Caldisericia bacterium]